MYMVTEGESSLMIRLLTTGAASFDFDININIQPPVPMQRNAIGETCTVGPLLVCVQWDLY